MKLSKKILLAIIGVIIVIVLAISIKSFNNPQQKGEKALTIIIVDEHDSSLEVELLNKVFYSDALTLTQFLEEQKSLGVVIEQSTYGSLIVEMLELKQDANSGPWWVYESDNNQVCIKDGFCPAADQINIYDGDIFTFKYISSF